VFYLLSSKNNASCGYLPLMIVNYLDTIEKVDGKERVVARQEDTGAAVRR